MPKKAGWQKRSVKTSNSFTDNLSIKRKVTFGAETKGRSTKNKYNIMKQN